MVRVTDISMGYLDVSSCRKVDASTYLEFIKNHRPNVGDILFSRVGSYGNSCYVKVYEEFCLGQNTVCISANTKSMEPYFLYCLLNSNLLKNQIVSLATGASQKTISLESIRKLIVPTPPLPTQKKIASVLSAYDDLIENNERRIKILEEMAQSIYREWFVNYRFPGHETVQMVDSELGEIPHGWEVHQLGKLTTINRGKSYRSTEISDTGGVSFINLKCIDRDGGFRDDGIRRFIGDYKDSHVVNGGDVVMAVTDMTQERRIIGRAARIPSFGFDGSVISMDLVSVWPNNDVELDYLYSMLRYSKFSDEVKEYANGTNVLHLSADRISEYAVAVPALTTQKEFSGLLRPLYRDIDVVVEQNRNLRQTRDLLLPKLISGELDAEKLDIAVA